MRPKVVISVLVVAFGLLGLVALLKGVSGKSPSGGEAPAVVAATALKSSDTNLTAVGAPKGGQPAAVSPEVRQALIETELARIRELQGSVDGTNNPMIIAALLERFSNPEREVRAAAIRALREMNDTNAVPGMEKAVAGINDPREKVAVLDAIDYIKLPDVTANVPPNLQTNYVDPAIMQAFHTNTHRKYPVNPAFLKGHQNIGGMNGAQAAPPDAPANQPQ